MKQKLAMILAATLALGMLSACGNSSGSAPDNSGSGSEGDSPKITWRAQSVETSGTERQNCVEHFAQLVSEATGGNFTIEVFSAGTLYGQEDLIEAVSNRVTECAFTSNDYHSGIEPMLKLAAFRSSDIWNDYDLDEKFLAMYEPLVKEAYDAMGLVYVGNVLDLPGECFMSNVKIETIDDFKGVLIRSGGLGQELYSALGASVVSMPMGDVYSAAKLGTIDAFEVGGYADNYGPYLKRPGQDLLAQSISGLASLNGAGEPYNVGCTLVDQHGATLAALGVLAALLDRDRTGKGHRVDASLLNAALDIQMEPLGLYLNGGKLSPRASTGLSTRYHEPPYGSYKTKDGYLTVSLTSFDNLHKIFDPAAVDQFTRDDQLHDRIRFDKMVADQMLKKTTAEWIKVFEEYNIWYAPVNEYEDMLKDPQVNHIQPFLEMDHPVAGHVRVLAHPLRYDGKTLPLRKLPPELGESTRELLLDLGYTNQQIDALAEAGIVKTHD